MTSSQTIDSAEQFHLAKDSNGRWVLTYRPAADVTLCLRVNVGGPCDWYEFRAELSRENAEPTLLGTFDIAPIEILPEHTSGYVRCEDVAPWNPSDEPEFLQIPEEYQDSFVVMVRAWANVADALVPGQPAERQVH